LAGKTAVVTGGSKGIGLEITRILLGRGNARVTGFPHHHPRLKATAATAVTVDLTTSEGAGHLVDVALAEHGANRPGSSTTSASATLATSSRAR